MIEVKRALVDYGFTNGFAEARRVLRAGVVSFNDVVLKDGDTIDSNGTLKVGKREIIIDTST